MDSEFRNFGPLLPKINGRELGKFVYLRLNFANGNLKIVSIEDEQVLYVRIDAFHRIYCINLLACRTFLQAN